MKPTALRDQVSAKAGIDADIVRIGKDVIEILTSGMYVSPITIYREYLQNSADAIDAARARGVLSDHQRGKVTIEIDHAARSVVIRDSGAGIEAHDAIPILLAIGESPKRGTDARGFRGVGRLSGLAYCRELEFRTKAVGENAIVSVIWDCRALRNRLAEFAFEGDLRQIISDVVSVRQERAEDRDDHFFEVRLLEITRLRNDVLLNEALIAHYLAQVGPVSFASNFSFAAAIQKRLSEYIKGMPIDLTVAGQPIYRHHRDEFPFPGTLHKMRLDDIEFVELADVDGKVGAIGWIGHHEYVRNIPTALGVRGLRARLGELQVGEASIFDESFKEARFNGWSIGEIHVCDRRIVPNARRDNFEANHHYYNLLAQLGPIAAKIAYRCRSASVSRNAGQNVRNVISEVERRLKERRRFDRAELSRFRSSVSRARAKVKRIADTQLRRRFEKKLERLHKSLASSRHKTGASAVAVDEAASLVSKLITNREQARKLIEELRRLCN